MLLLITVSESAIGTCLMCCIYSALTERRVIANWLTQFALICYRLRSFIFQFLV